MSTCLSMNMHVKKKVVDHMSSLSEFNVPEILRYIYLLYFVTSWEETDNSVPCKV
jgi:hypothetical protein